MASSSTTVTATRQCRHVTTTFLVTCLLLPVMTPGSSPSSLFAMGSFLPADQGSLYEPTDPLLILTQKNFTQYVLNKSNAFMIEFYASWCGHCMNFAPVWKSFASDVKDWGPVVKVAAVNCADPKNTDLCRKYDIMTYPTIKFFWVNVTEGMTGDFINIPHTRSPQVIRHELVNQLVMRRAHSKTLPAPTWPEISPIEALSKTHLIELLDISPNERRPIIIVLDEYSYSKLGVEVILDLSQYQDAVLVRRVVGQTDDGELIKQLLPLEQTYLLLPALIHLQPNGQVTLLQSGERYVDDDTYRKQFVAKIKKEFIKELRMDEKDPESANQDSLGNGTDPSDPTVSSNNWSNGGLAPGWLPKDSSQESVASATGSTSSSSSSSASSAHSPSIVNNNNNNVGPNNNNNNNYPNYNSRYNSRSTSSSHAQGGSTRAPFTLNGSPGTGANGRGSIYGHDERVYMSDLYNTIRYALRQEVALHRQLNATQMAALQRFVDTLSRYFPFNNENPRRFMKRMSQWFIYRKNATVATEHLIAQMRISDGYLPPMQPWKECQSTKANITRGYPCGLWILFHTLTVNEYLQHRALNEANPHQVLRSMKNFVEYFFSCATCRDHFMERAANLSQELVHDNSSILWLWRVHNEVNARLTGTASDDPHHPKVQFPPPSLCPACRTWNNEWDEDKVFNFLINHYHKENIIRNSGAATVAGPSLTAVQQLFATLATLIFTWIMTLEQR